MFYVATFHDAVYVLHTFEKRSRKTSRRDLESGRARYRQLVAVRASHG